MQKHLLNIISAAIIMIIVVSACRKPEVYPPEPYIEYKSFVKLVDTSINQITKGRLTVTYRDGDGDIGVYEGDTLTYNFFVFYWEMQNGEFVKLDLDPPLHGRIPDLQPPGQHKSIKGDITYEMDINFLSEFDTMYLEVYLEDRALNRSNIVETPWINIRY